MTSVNISSSHLISKSLIADLPIKTSSSLIFHNHIFYWFDVCTVMLAVESQMYWGVLVPDSFTLLLRWSVWLPRGSRQDEGERGQSQVPTGELMSHLSCCFQSCSWPWWSCSSRWWEPEDRCLLHHYWGFNLNVAAHVFVSSQSSKLPFMTSVVVVSFLLRLSQLCTTVIRRTSFTETWRWWHHQRLMSGTVDHAPLNHVTID